uniref:Uncharacterized protein n=1 Tax=Tanacetum cinerariifolium TaxID=118510 RepID=A0A699GJG6_TANCI|nr:hypothetical protein [Tanacetum cinerariifolium]
MSDSQNELREFYKTDVISMSISLSKNSKELQQELTEEVQEVLNLFESMESNVDQTSKRNKLLQNKIDQLLEANIANDVRNLVMQSYVEIKNKEEIERFSKESKDVVFWVKKGFSTYVSTESGSDGPIRHVHGYGYGALKDHHRVEMMEQQDQNLDEETQLVVIVELLVLGMLIEEPMVVNE